MDVPGQNSGAGRGIKRDAMHTRTPRRRERRDTRANSAPRPPNSGAGLESFWCDAGRGEQHHGVARLGPNKYMPEHDQAKRQVTGRVQAAGTICNDVLPGEQKRIWPNCGAPARADAQISLI